MVQVIHLPKNELGIKFWFLSLLFFFLIMFQGQLLVAQSSMTLEEYVIEEGEEETETLRSIIFDNVPTIYGKEGRQKQSDQEFPQKLMTDVASLGILENENPDFRTVKLIEVEITNASEKSMVRLTRDKLRNFVNLQYVLISSQVEINSSEVDAMLSGYQPGDIVQIYRIFTVQ